MAKKLYEESKIAAIGEKIREKTGGEERYTTAEMPSGVEEVFEAGKQAERDAFWDVFQQNGNQNDYAYAFAYDTFTDDNYNPKYDLVASPNMFYMSGVTDTKVPIVSSSSLSNVFRGAISIRTIRKLVFGAITQASDAFKNCYELSDITIEGIINADISFENSNRLNKASITSIINALANTAKGKTLTLSISSIGNSFGINSEQNLIDWANIDEGNLSCVDNGDGTVTLNGDSSKYGDRIMFPAFECEADNTILRVSVDGCPEEYIDRIEYYVYGPNYAYERLDYIPVDSSCTVILNSGDRLGIRLFIVPEITLNDVTVAPKIAPISFNEEWDELIATKPKWTISLVEVGII